ncbi:AAA family ATPase [Edaphobacter sp. HDX4]|uniref:ATP-dependent nuclease n=1 Tax=Edaphobacter sp. HDX4 TaxID=2794064 RepID=UPI002FE65814
MNAPVIYRLIIERFRCIKSFTWQPAKGVNVILGGGDVGKTTILDAIALLLSPTNPAALADTDYCARAIDAGFVIEAVVSLPSQSGINGQTKPSWPWQWDGKDIKVPTITGEASSGEPVYRFRLRGTEELELIYEIIQPDGTADSLSVALRRSIGLVRLSGDDRNDRDLRLVQGSALERLISDKALRSRLTTELAKSDVASQLEPEGRIALETLDSVFKAKNLPDNLDLALTGGQGLSISALIGLTANRDGVQLPLASWGSGTRRYAALAIAEQNQGEAPITIVDEVERGLEPYRQRVLIENLLGGPSQVFLTTHSPAAISAAEEASLWYVDHNGRIGGLASASVARQRKHDPECFLARLAIVAEGVTEFGFASALLEKAFGTVLQKHGVHITNGGGHESALGLLEALSVAGLRFGGFADDEGKHPERWERVSEKLGTLLFRWQSGCLEENIIAALPDDKLEALLIDPEDQKTGMRLRTLADRLGIREKDFVTIKATADTELRTLILSAALGTVPQDKTGEKKQYQSHSQTWFKTLDGGRELAEKIFRLGVWHNLKNQLLPFCNAVRKSVNLDEVPDLNT